MLPVATIMKHFSRKCLVFALLIFTPLPLFVVARETASWRPQKVAGLPYDGTVVISPDEHFVANASSAEDGLVSVRNLQHGEEAYHTAIRRSVTSLAFSSDSRSLAISWRRISSSGHTKRIGVSMWNLEGQQRNFQEIGANLAFDTPTQLRFSPDSKTLWMASTDNLRAWEVASGKLKWQWRKGDFGRNSSLPFFSAISKDCQLYFRSDSDGYTVWDMKAQKQLLHTKLPFLFDSDLDFSPDSSLATYFADTPNGSFYFVVDARAGRKLWQADEKFGVALEGDKAVVLNKSSSEIHNSRTGEFLYRLPSLPNVSLLASESRDWLYSVNGSNELFRQRFR